MIQIKNYWNGTILFTSQESTTLAQALQEAVQAKADLCGADLRDSNLRDSNLRGSNLRGSNLCGADLRGADLCGADLCGADLCGADLCGADLCDIRNDFFDVLLRAKHEIPGLREAIVNGKVNGTVYEGECACLLGTIAKVKGTTYDALPNLRPNSSRPIERFFLGLKKGDNPTNSSISKIVLDWLDEFVSLLNS